MPRPEYQKQASSTTFRAIPDVSALADITPGWPVVTDGALQTVGGKGYDGFAIAVVVGQPVEREQPHDDVPCAAESEQQGQQGKRRGEQHIFDCLARQDLRACRAQCAQDDAVVGPRLARGGDRADQHGDPGEHRDRGRRGDRGGHLRDKTLHLR